MEEREVKYSWYSGYHWDKLVPHFLVHYQVKALQELASLLNLHFLQRPDFMLYSLVFGIKHLINKLWQQNVSAVVLPRDCLRCEHFVEQLLISVASSCVLEHCW